MTRPSQYSSFHHHYNVQHTLSNSSENRVSHTYNQHDIGIASSNQFNPPQTWHPCAYRNLEVDLANKENITTNHQVRDRIPNQILRVHDFALYPWHFVHNDI